MQKSLIDYDEYIKIAYDAIKSKGYSGIGKVYDCGDVLLIIAEIVVEYHVIVVVYSFR